MYLCAKIYSMKQEMNKGKIFINLISIALLLLYSMEGLSATLPKERINYVGEVDASDIRMSVMLTLDTDNTGTLNVFKRNKKCDENNIVEFYFVSLEADTLLLSGEIVYDLRYLFERKGKSAYIYPLSTSTDEVLFYDKSIRSIELRSKKDKNTDSLFLQRIIDGDFFEQEHSESQDYILVVKHCLSHTDESYDETFSDGLSRMLQKYPQKIEGLWKALKRLSPKQRENAYHNMIVYIVSAWMMEQSSDSIDPKMFYHTFPFLEQSSMIDKILMEQMQ